MDTKNIRFIEVDLEERVETGAVQFGNDWPGLFIRGDDCLQLQFFFREFNRMKENDESPFHGYSVLLTRLSAAIRDDVKI